MRVRLHKDVAKLVAKNRGTLTAADEVNRALKAYYEPAAKTVVITTESLEYLLGKTNARRFLRAE